MTSPGKAMGIEGEISFHRHDPLARAIQMICLDVDGTLLDSRFQLHSNVTTAIKRASEAGLHITLATGRNLDSTLPIAEALGLNLSIISSGGAHIRTDDGLVVEIQLDSREAEEIIKMGLNTGSGMFVDRPERAWALGNEEFRSRYSSVARTTEPASLGEVLIPAPMKISLINEKEALGRIRAVIARTYPELQLTFPFETVLDITPKEASKGNALRILVELVGVSLEQTAAVGDSENDLSGFAVSGLSIAMSNAPEEVRHAADWIAPSNDDEGVFWIVSHILESNSRISAFSKKIER